MILNYISLPVFIISFAIGLFFVYIMGTEMKTVYIYPNPNIVDKILLKDKADNCFNFVSQEVECPNDSSLITNVPVQA
jgi:hypothetical protein